ncbi:MAG TPA: RusA family crossover junction endodeoxyribonuclease [Polyangiaceae bacterium]
MIEFFVSLVPPTTSHHHKKIVRIGKFSKLADRPELVAAKNSLDAALYPHQPLVAMDGPVRLEVELTWPWRKGETKKRRALGRVPHTSKPDCSNMLKTLEDRLVKLCFIEDDKAVADVHVRKWWGDTPGIRVRITPLEGEGAYVI